VKLLAGAEPRSGTILEYPARYQSELHPWILWLFAESQCRCPQNGWGITFTNNAQPTDSLSDFRWLGVPDDSPLLPKLVASGRTIFNFETPTPQDIVYSPIQTERESLAAVSEISPASLDAGPSRARVSVGGPPPRRPVPTVKHESKRRPLLVFAVLSPLLIISVAFLAYAIGRGPVHAPQSSPENKQDLSSERTKAIQDTPTEGESSADSNSQEQRQAKQDSNAAAVIEDESLADSKTALQKATDSHSDDEKASDAAGSNQAVAREDVYILFPGDYQKFPWIAPIGAEGVNYIVCKGDDQRLLAFKKEGDFSTKGFLHEHGDEKRKYISASATKHSQPMWPKAKETEDPVTLIIKARGGSLQRIYLASNNSGLQPDSYLPINRIFIDAANNPERLNVDEVPRLNQSFVFPGADAVQFRLTGTIQDSDFRAKLEEAVRLKLITEPKDIERLTEFSFPVRSRDFVILSDESLEGAVQKLRAALSGATKASQKSSAIDRFTDYRSAYVEALTKIKEIAESKSQTDEAGDASITAQLMPVPDSLEESDLHAKLSELSYSFATIVDSIIPSTNDQSREDFNKARASVQAARNVAGIVDKVAETLDAKRSSLKNGGELLMYRNKLKPALYALAPKPSPSGKLDVDTVFVQELARQLDQLYGVASGSRISPPDVLYKLEAQRVSGENAWHVIAEGIGRESSKGASKLQ
jgi:hypothetical protein